MTKPHEGLQYWDGVAAAGNYLLDLPARIDKSVSEDGWSKRESFHWEGTPGNWSKAHDAEWARMTARPWIGKKAVSHSLTFATHLSGQNMGVTALEVDLPGKRIQRVTSLIIDLASYDDVEPEEDTYRVDAIFRRAYDEDDSGRTERDVADFDYRILQQELLSGVLFKADKLLRYGERMFDQGMPEA